MSCSACGAPAPAEARFCPACGHSLVSRPDERRIATVLFADLVGFTSFSESADPEHVKDVVDRCFEALSSDVTAYGGQVDKIVGDALIALFGAPVAHEDDAERAVRCGLQMQRTLARVRAEHGVTAEMRIGVNTGEVLVGAMRAGGDYTAMGDVMNTASRLQSNAEPGSVVVGPTTYAATHHVVRYESLGALAVKGRGERVDAWVAVEALAPPGKRRRARTPLVGREPELSLLRGIVDAALARNRAHLVLLTGDAGVGKSRLAGEVARHAECERDAVVLRGECVPYGEDVWWPIAETIRAACDIAPEATIDEARANLCGHVAVAIGRPADDPEVNRIARGLLYLLGFDEEYHDIDPTRARDDALRSAQGMFSYLARKQPLVIVLSDLHWADEMVLELVERMFEWLRSLPFVLLATARPELKDRWRPEPGRHDLTVLNLEPLDASAVATLVDELLGEAATPALVSLLHERSGGNPFFVEELAALIRESGTTTAGLEGRLPATLQGLVAARLDALPPLERTVLEDCAVVGAAGSLESVHALAATNPATIDAAAALGALADRELIELDGDEFRFPSEVVRDVAYGTLTKAERARRHASLGDYLAERSGADDSTAISERVAHHFGTAAELMREIGTITGIDPGVPERALRSLEKAADRARGAEVWKSASRLYDQALAVMPADAPDETRWRLLLGRARALAEQRELPEARRDVEDILEEATDDSRTTARCLTLLAEIEHMEGRGDESIATFERALAMWRSIGDEQGVAEALRGRGITAMFLGDLDGADGYFSEALEVFRQIGDRRGEAWAVQNLATISFFRGEPTMAEQRLAAAGEMFHDLGDWGGLNWSFAVLAWVRFMQGRLDEAEAIALEQLPESDANGNRWVSGILGVLLANIALWGGRPQAAVGRARDALDRFNAIGDAWGGDQARAALVRSLGASGRVDDALHELELGTGRDVITGNVALEDLVRAQILVHTGDRDALPAALHLSAHVDAYGLDAERRMVLGLALLQAGRLAEAIAELETARQQIPDVEAGAGAAITAALSLAYVTFGRAAEAKKLADDAVGQGTYLDQLQAAVAGAFARLQLGDDDSTDAFDALVVSADATESRLDQTIVRLARARAWRALDRSDAEEAEADVRTRCAGLGIELTGWDAVFTRAARGDRA